MKTSTKSILFSLLLVTTLLFGVFALSGTATVAKAEVETTLLTELNLTVTAPIVGETYDETIVSAEPEKYTATLERVYDDTDKKNISDADEFLAGHKYTYEIIVTAETGYTIDGTTKVYINEKQAGSYSIGDYYVQFQLPIEIVVNGGTRYTNDNFNVEYAGEDFFGGYVYLKADPAPEGQTFVRWDIVKAKGSSTYNSSERASQYIYSDDTSVTFTAVYANLIDEISLTMPKITVGGHPSFTNFVKTDANAENYEFIVQEWYYYENGTNKIVMTEEDTFEKGVSYHISFTIEFDEGYWMPSEYDENITINGNSVYTNSRNYISGYVNGTHTYHTLIPMNVSVTGGTLMVDGVPTNETEFMPGTELTVVVDESLYPEGQVFRYWNVSGAHYITYEDNRTPSFTFTLKDYKYSPPYNISISAIYKNLSALTGTYVYTMHPVAGESPSYEIFRRGTEYDTEVLGWYEGDTLLENSHVFELGKTYTIRVKATAAPSYYINDPNKDFRGDISFNGLLVFDGEIIEYEENGAYVIYEHSIVAKYAQTSAAITIDTPIPGKLPSYEVVKASGTNINVYIDYWKVYDSEKGWREMEDDEIFMVGGEYRPYIVFQGNEDYFVKSPNFAVTINGEKGSSYSTGSSPYAEGYYTAFTVLAGVETYDVIIENGTASIDSTTITESNAGVVVTITANTAEEGKAFKCWQIVSGTNVIIVDANSATTTFDMPANDVRISAIYRYTPHTVTVIGGSADMENVGKEETVTISIGEIPTGKYFSHWVVNNGGVELADANAKTTTFVMGEEAVEIEAIFAEKPLLTEVRFTVTAPIAGQLYDGSLTSTEPTKYTATFSRIKIGSTEFDLLTPYVAGARYNYYFNITIDEKYATDGNTKFYLNSTVVYRMSGNEYYSNAITTPYPITVVNGGAFNDKAGTTSVENLFQYDYFYVIADPAPEGFKFHHWDVVGTYNWVDNSLNQATLYVRQGSETLTFTAVYEDIHTITVNGGTADASEAIVGTKIYITKGAIPDGKVFLYWSLNGANIGNVSNFIMPDEDAIVEAVYHTHTYDENVWEYNDDRHWHECTDISCPDINHSISYNGQYYHKYDHACDTDCNDGCGYTRTITHDFTGDWVTDENQHWHVCKVAGCGEIDEKVNHSGGTATCKSGAICDVCGKAYTAVDADNHEGTAEWTKTATTHGKVYGCCDEVVVATEEHHWENGVCSECEYACSHVGGTATCKSGAICDVCGKAYTAVDADNHEGTAEWTKTATTHGKVYSCCDEVAVVTEEHHWENGICSECEYVCSHSGGTATCITKAKCETCGKEYGSYDADNHEDEVVWYITATTHEKCYDDCCEQEVIAKESHNLEGGICSVCEFNTANIINSVVINELKAPLYNQEIENFYFLLQENIYTTLTINGEVINKDTDLFGNIYLWDFALFDENRDIIKDANHIITSGTYYLGLALGSVQGYPFADDVTVTVNGATSVETDLNYNLIVYAKYEVSPEVIEEVTVNGVEPQFGLTLDEYYESTMDMTINGATYSGNGGLYGNIGIEYGAILDSNRQEIEDDDFIFVNGTYYVGFVLWADYGYQFPANIEDLTVAFDGADDVEFGYNEGFLVILAEYTLVPEIIEEVTVNGVEPQFGLTLGEYFESTRDMTINGATYSGNDNLFGNIGMEYGAILDSNKQEIKDNAFIFVNGTYYVGFILLADYGYQFPANIEDLTVAFDGAVDVEFAYDEGLLIILAEYDVTHTCVDTDTEDHLCDLCGETVSQCTDVLPKDHVCDICGEDEMGTHEAATGKHTCDYCGETVSQCTDVLPKDHVCDICGEDEMGTHEAATGKHTCDYCGETVSQCTDVLPKDHVCDICGEDEMGTHEAATGKHTCDYCGEMVSQCTDVLPKDHVCDICGEDEMGTHEAATGKHTCDYCGETISGHTDANTDGICDTCGWVDPNFTPVVPNPDGETPDTAPDTTPEVEGEKEGLSAGAIAGIAVGSTVGAVGLGAGGFAIFWFVIKKKSLAELLAIFKKK